MISRAGTLRQGKGVSSIFWGSTFFSAMEIFDRAKNKIPYRTKTQVRSPNKKTLEELASDSPRVLFSCKAFFPMQMFPDQIVVDESKVTIIKKYFFQSELVRSVMIRDIANIQVQSSYFFATVNIVDKHFITQPISVDYIWNNEAYALRRIVMGLIIAKDNNVDLSEYDDVDVIEMVKKIGSSRGLGPSEVEQQLS